MKNVQPLIFRAMCFLLAGILMFFFTDSVTFWFVRVMGILFLVPGLVSIGTFFRDYARKDATRVLLPVIGVGSAILGIILILLPHKFITALMYFLAAAILLGGITSIINLIQFRKYTHIGPVTYIIPILLCAAGIYIIIHTQDSIEISFKIFGIASIIYALTEIYYAIHFRKIYRQIRQGNIADDTEAETVEEVQTSEVSETTTETPDDIPSEDAGQEPATAGTIDFTQDIQPQDPTDNQ